MVATYIVQTNQLAALLSGIFIDFEWCGATLMAMYSNFDGIAAH